MRRFIQLRGKTSKPRIWEITVTEGSIYTVWGQLGGQMDSTTETPPPKNVGKKNEESSEVQAQKIADRYIKNKTKKGGYVEVDLKTNKPLVSTVVSDFDFNRPHENSTSFKIFKPQNTMNVYMTKMLEGLEALLSRKRDGYMHYLVVDDEGTPRLFSANMEFCHEKEREEGIPLLDRFPMIEADLQKLNLPPRSMLVGEVCVSAHSSKDDLGHAVDSRPYVASILKSYTSEALRKQKEGGDLAFCIWDVIFIEDRPMVKEVPTKERFEFLHQLLQKARTHWITVPELVTLNADGFCVQSHDGQDLELEYDDEPSIDIVNWARSRKWEGFVVIDPNSTYGDKSWEFHGKNPRPKFICKLKPDLDVDVLVYWDPKGKQGVFGKGKHSGEVGSVEAYLWDDENEVTVPVGRVGLGITDKQAHNFADIKLYPMVWKVTCKGWTEKGKMESASLDRVREDKTPKECNLDQRPGATE